jgi:hypothetical protein
VVYSYEAPLAPYRLSVGQGQGVLRIWGLVRRLDLVGCMGVPRVSILFGGLGDRWGVAVASGNRFLLLLRRPKAMERNRLSQTFFRIDGG